MELKNKYRNMLEKMRELITSSGLEKYISTRRVFLFSLMAIPALFLTNYFIAFSLMLLTVALSLAVNRFGLNRFGLELATFSTVTMAQVFGPETGAILGLVYICLQMFSGSTPGVYLMWVVPSYVAAGYFAGTSTLDVTTLGLYTAITLQSIFTFMTFLTSRSRLPKFIQYATFNITINMLLFQTIAGPLMSFL